MSPKQILITGVNGFIGDHMARYLLDQSMEVYGIGRRKEAVLQHPKLKYFTCDLTEFETLIGLLVNTRFDYIIHLAGESNVSDSWQSPMKVMRANIIGTLNLLEAIRCTQINYVKGVLIVSSSHEYGVLIGSNDRHVFTEQSPTLPISPYGSSKWLATQLSLIYHQMFGLPVTIARSFNLIAPGSLKGVCGQIAKQIVEIEKGMREPNIVVGNPNIQRDFLDSRDAVAAYWALLENYTTSVGQIYNVCRGQSISIQSLIQLFQKYTDRLFHIKINAALSRPKEPLISYGDSTKLRSATGWKPNISIEQTINDLLIFAREREKGRGRE